MRVETRSRPSARTLWRLSAVILVLLLAGCAAQRESVKSYGQRLIGSIGDLVGRDEGGRGRVENDDLLASQSAILDRSLSRLRSHTPGKTDLFVVAFGGDSSERVFRNEVEYIQKLFEQRFGAKDRVLVLLNNPETTGSVPLATYDNLSRALTGVVSKMNPAEDILFLYMTSHGSPDHRFYLNMEPLFVGGIGATGLRNALDRSGAQNRVVVVSACYSGGFLPTLDDGRSLLMSAARSDRSSFGCGTDSDFTFFGEAFLIEALNQTGDFVEAFSLARSRVGSWERALGYEPSEPQIVARHATVDRLRQWSSGTRLGAKVPFVPPR